MPTLGDVRKRELKSVDIDVEMGKELVTGRLRWRQEICGDLSGWTSSRPTASS